MGPRTYADRVALLQVTTVWLLLILILASGCNSLRTNRHARNLSEARLLSLRGADLLQQDNFQEAGPLFQEALSHSIADERAHWGIAEVLWQQGDAEQAIRHMSRAAELSGRDPDLLVRLGEMHQRSGNLAAALQQAEQAIVINRQHAQAWALKGQVLWQQNAHHEALDCYQRALIHNPANSEARVAVAEIYRSLGQPQRALATLDKLADNQPTQSIPAKAWMLRGQALCDLNERDDAKDCLRQASLYASDSDAQLLLKLAQLQYEYGELAEARLCLGRALRNNPHDPDALSFQRMLDKSFNEYLDHAPTVPTVSAGWRYEHDGESGPADP